MTIEERYKWLYSYTLPCTRGEEVLFERLLREGSFVDSLAGDYSRENVRKHFLVTHNLATLDGIHKADNFHAVTGYLHLAIPYQIIESEGRGLTAELREPFYDGIPNPLFKRRFNERELGDARKRGVLDTGSRILIVHAGIIAETCALEDVTKFDKTFERQKA